ncbi:hypothetical protein [Streptomyces rubiginosohelvolus]|uniref:hypothetical protein n=1 Tax=Streptomyces rubiginosohelvolus TaxID=67362 RepID=UPI0035DF9B43
MEFKLLCDAQSIDLAKSGTIWGNIWVEISGRSFPESNWNDIPVAFLSELLDAVEFVRDTKGKRRRVRFFDGPYWIDLVGLSDATLSISANGHGAGQEVTVSVHDVAQSLATVRTELLHACLKRGWGDHMDVRRLQAQ